MPINNDPAAEPKGSVLFSAAEVRTMLDEFRELVREGMLQVTPENQVRSLRPAANSDVQELPLKCEPPLDSTQSRQPVIEQSAGQTHTKQDSHQPQPSLREQVIDKVVQEILEKWRQYL